MGEIYFKEDAVIQSRADLLNLENKLNSRKISITVTQGKGEITNKILDTEKELVAVSTALVNLTDKTERILGVMQQKFTGTDGELAEWFHTCDKK